MPTPNPPIDTPRAHPACSAGRALALILGLISLTFTVFLVIAEESWNANNTPKMGLEDAFINGSIGTELAPLVAFEVLPELFPDEFSPIDRYMKQPNGTAGDWIDQFGFIRKSLAPKEFNDGTGLPVGFVLSHHRPGSGAPSPVPFVGLSCAACHSAEIRTDSGKPGVVLFGVGNPTMNLLAFSEAVRNALVKRKTPSDKLSEYVLTLEAVADAQAKRGRKLSPYESAMVTLWIRVARAETLKYSEVIDDPLAADQLFNPNWIPAGPSRTQPFRSLVRVHLNRPGMSASAAQTDRGFSKIPAVYFQAHEYHGLWAQFDGSVSNIVARSTFAASTAGANVNNLALPDLASNIRLAADYTEKLGPPTWKQVFEKDLDGVKVTAGKPVYMENCYHCHGGPDGKGAWTWDKTSTSNRFGLITPLPQIGTDPERVQFRHAEEVTDVLYAEFVTDFRKNHPLGTFNKSELRASVGENAGYYNGPIAGAFLRAPYLHNASVLTLAELIGLTPRRAKFFRGRNPYDLKNVGFQSPEVHDGKDEFNPAPKHKDYYFLFDTSVRGNSNRGHDYPKWAFDRKPGQAMSEDERKKLENLLEYLKSL